MTRSACSGLVAVVVEGALAGAMVHTMVDMVRSRIGEWSDA